MLKLPAYALLGGLSLFTCAAHAQSSRWRAGLLGMATYDRVSNNFQVDFANPGANAIWATHEAARGYGIGFSVERTLNEHWALEIQPRYHQLRADYEVRTGSIVSYGHAAGPQVQLPVGGRYCFGGSRRVAPYLLGHAVLSWTNLSPNVDRLYLDFQNGPTGGIGYAASGEQWQLGLEAGAGVRLADLLAVNLLAHYGLNNTRLARVRSDRNVSTGGAPLTQLTTTGTMQGHLLSLAVQGVLYLHH